MRKLVSKIDWWIVFSLIPLSILSLSAMNSFGIDGGEGFFAKQLIWFGISFVLLFFTASLDLSFLKSNFVHSDNTYDTGNLAPYIYNKYNCTWNANTDNDICTTLIVIEDYKENY